MKSIHFYGCFGLLVLSFFFNAPVRAAADSRMCLRQDFPRHSPHSFVYWNRMTGAEIVNSLPGDVNQDAQVSVVDLALIQKAVNEFTCSDLGHATSIVVGSSVLNASSISEPNFLSCIDFEAIADVNGDGNVDATDLNIIKKIILGFSVDACVCSAASVPKFISNSVATASPVSGTVSVKKNLSDGTSVVYGVSGAGDTISVYGSNGVKIKDFLSDPKSVIRGMALDQQGNLYVAGSFSFQVSPQLIPQILVFNPSGGLMRRVGQGQLTAAEGVAVDSVGNIFIADLSDSVKMFDSCGMRFESLGGPDVLHKVMSVTISSTDDLFVLDQVSAGVTHLVKFH